MFRIPTVITVALFLIAATTSSAEERSLWQKFKDFFSPSPTVVGEGPEYDELREIDKKIGKLEGKYSRERRANNKKYIREEIDKLKLQREKLVKQIEEKEKAQKDVKSSVAASSSSKPASAAVPSSAATTAKQAAVCAHDTVFVHDTVTVHDTLYVIVSGKPQETAPSNTAADAAQQPATEPAQNTPAADSATAPSNK